jgi:uncharacterized phage infection (PIP) family protein YhgE
VEKRFMTAVWNDQKAIYEPFPLLFDLKQDGTPLPSHLYEFKNDETPAVTERIETLLSQIEDALPNFLGLTNRLNTVLSNSANLTSNLNLVASNARPVVSDLAAVTAQWNHPGALGEWLLPTNLNRGLEDTLGNAKTTLSSANTTLINASTNLAALAENLERTLDNLAGITSNLHQQVEANTNLLRGISDTIIHADDLIQGLKRHWLLRSAFKTKATNAPPVSTPARPIRSPKARAEP